MIAAEDDIVTCEDGHPLYRVRQTIPLHGARLRAADFERLDDQAQEPRFAEVVVKTCPHCGAPWLRGASFVQINVAGEWRPRKEQHG